MAVLVQLRVFFQKEVKVLPQFANTGEVISLEIEIKRIEDIAVVKGWHKKETLYAEETNWWGWQPIGSVLNLSLIPGSS